MRERHRIAVLKRFPVPFLVWSDEFVTGRCTMTVLQKVKSFFKRPKSKDKAGQPQSASGNTDEKKAAEDPQKKAGAAGGQQSSGTT